MAHILERKIKKKPYYYLVESYRSNGKVKTIQTYLGTRPPMSKARPWTHLSPDIIKILKERPAAKVTIAPSPDGKYRTIVCDPPWPVWSYMEEPELLGRPPAKPLYYHSMTISQIKNDRKRVPVRKLTDKTGCFLFLWATVGYLPAALDILAAWGFRYMFTMVWHKPGGWQVPHSPHNNCEFVVVGRRGKLDFLTTRAFFICFNAKRREHSRKPDEFYDLLRRVSPEPRIDMFSRGKHRGFDQYGNETTKFS